MKLFSLFFILIPCLVLSQGPTEQQLQAFRENQYEIDKNYGGIGPIFFKPGLGKGAEIPEYWYGVSMLSDILEFQFAVGKADKVLPVGYSNDPYAPPAGDYGRDFGYMMSVGINHPLNFLTIGSYQNEKRMFRGHPVAGASLGWFNFKESHTSPGKRSVYFMNFNPGYRIKFPIVSAEFNLNARLGFGSTDDFSGTGFQFYKGIGFNPSLTLRFDALKGLLNPSMVSVKGSLTTISNVESKTTYTGSTRTSYGRIDRYTTTTTADVTVTPMNLGVQDVGPYFGIGPKMSFMSPRRSTHINMGKLYGVVAEGRGGPIDAGITFEGGNVGHGSVLEFKGENEPRKKLKKTKSEPAGSLSTVNGYLNVGVDISQLFLVPFGIVMDKGEATSFLSASAGIIVGGHYAFNQQYDEEFWETAFDDEIADNDPSLLKNKYVDPSDVGFGYLGGFYFGVHIGAVSFKATNYRYYGAPFASTTMYSVAWKYPLNR